MSASLCECPPEGCGGFCVASGMTLLPLLWFGGVEVDLVSLIVAALAVGAAAGFRDTASAAVKDAYESVKALTRKRLAERRDGELVLARHAEAPKTWEGPLAAELSAAGADMTRIWYRPRKR